MFMLFNYSFLLYTDPGSGALILQLVMAGIIGSLFYLKKIKDTLFGIKKKPFDSINPNKKNQVQAIND